MQNSVSNSPNSPNQPLDTADNGVILARTRAARRIDAQTISEIARLCAKALTESEACRRIGIKPRHWFDWKTRHNRAEKFCELLEAFRADRIETLIARIEASADGVGMKQPDWRAAAHLLAISDAKRFSDAGMRSSVEINVNVQPAFDIERIRRAAALIYGRVKQAQVGDVGSEPKQIENAKP